MSQQPLDPRVELGRRLREQRLARKLTIDGLAAVGAMDVSNLRKIEAGEGNPRLVTVLKLAGILEIELQDLFDGVDPYALPATDRPTRVSDVDERFWRPRDRVA